MIRIRFAVLAIAALGALGVVLPAAAHTRAHTKPHVRAAAKVTAVTVTAGKPSEFRFTLSKKVVKKGVVVFKVMNKGTIPHDFKIAGKRTALLSPGKTATLRVVFKKAGRFPYLCTVSGHAAAGMKGVLRVS